MTRIAIVGPGAVASVVAWHLARAGLSPTLVARGATASLIAREGLTVIREDKEERVDVAATDNARALGHQDIVLVGFKAQDWRTGVDAVAPLVGPDTIVAPLLNGVPWWFFQGKGGAHEGRVVQSVDPDGALAARFAPDQIAGGVVYLAASRESPSRIRWSGRKRIIFGSPMGAPNERVSSLVALLRSADIDAAASDDIRRDLWIKLLGNATYNPLSVVAEATMDRMAGDPGLARIARLMMEETLDVGRAFGVVGDLDLEERMRPQPWMMNIRSSMLQDYEAGRPLELGAIVDAVVELGALANVPTPTLQTIGALAADRSRQSIMRR